HPTRSPTLAPATLPWIQPYPHGASTLPTARIRYVSKRLYARRAVIHTYSGSVADPGTPIPEPAPVERGAQPLSHERAGCPIRTVSLNSHPHRRRGHGGYPPWRRGQSR